jgi:alpha-tubulin suppressor-like RCC1 family protein
VRREYFSDGNLFTWGSNVRGSLGDGGTTSRSSPGTTVGGGTNWKQVSINISSAGRFTSAIKTDGTLWSWGDNYYGQLGDGNTFTSTLSPITTTVGGNNWKQTAAGSLHTSAIKTDGTLWSWGGGANGQLGDGTTSTRLSPVTTAGGGTNWKQVACGSEHTAAIKTDGTLWTWGRSNGGSLGDGTTSNRLSPVTTAGGGTNWKQVSCGYTSIVATTDLTI